MNNVRKAVILCAGRGTRMMPYTKSQPKEMLPILTTPLLQKIIEQIAEANIKEIFILITKEKECIIKHLDNLFPEIKITYDFQTQMQGTGPATMIAKEFVNNEPFLLIFPDELMLDENPYKILVEDFEENNSAVLSSYKIPLEDAHRYGIIIPKEGNNIKGVIEKPKDNPPSDLASLGTYLLTPDVFDHIENNYLGEEICIVDAVNLLPNLRHIELMGKRFDLGNPLGFAKANAYVALQTYPEFKDWIKEQI